ncbi:hypothetical protein CGX12_11805 [Zobellella denitrificans]|uniref:Cro/CI family transcriptional regulator n=1 Tax=Zobellella denitrificans TaxID=347534 RepID=UPI000B8C5399|nr:Cro/CI family transcriptional regulator [Zobellella denitrificans]OXS14898.1 hypothetical protein CGX12_11805 [Zobellella denitrificans]
MNQIPLRKYVKGKRQGAVARMIGVSQGALSQMLKSERRIYVRVDGSGSAIEAFEIKTLGKNVADQEPTQQPT